MYCEIKHILENMDENTLLNLCNDANNNRSSIDLDSDEDPIVILVNKAINRSEEEINPFLMPLKILPFTTVPERIKTIAVQIAIKNLYQRNPSYRTNMPESITNDYKDCLKELEAYRKRERMIPGVVFTEAAKASSEVKINKKESDRIFSKDLLNKF
jgi:hypothetical protein